MPTKILSVRCPDSIRERIEARKASTGKDFTATVVELLEWGLAVADGVYTLSDSTDDNVSNSLSDRANVLEEVAVNFNNTLADRPENLLDNTPTTVIQSGAIVSYNLPEMWKGAIDEAISQQVPGIVEVAAANLIDERIQVALNALRAEIPQAKPSPKLETLSDPVQSIKSKRLEIQKDTLTSQALADLYGISLRNVTKWQYSGKLLRLGWERVTMDGERIGKMNTYRRIEPTNQNFDPGAATQENIGFPVEPETTPSIDSDDTAPTT